MAAAPTFVSLVSCAVPNRRITDATESRAEGRSPTSEDAPTDAEAASKEEAESTEGDEKAVLAEEKASSAKEPTVASLALEVNESVEKWIEYFTVKDRERFQRFLSRGLKYRKVVEDVLIENDLPPELYFLPLIESGYQNHATSRAKAVGVWQFMPATARRYGLTVSTEVDERRDPIRATEAAARYLRDLYNIFGSWPLAMAAYNAGEYRIIGCILKGKSRDFWTLASLNVLPRETAAYVPKMLAAAIIGADPDKYKFQKEDTETYPELEAVEVPSPIKLSGIAKASGVSLAALREVNPHLRADRTPSSFRRYEVWVPKSGAEALRREEHTLAAARIKSAPSGRVLAKDASRTNYHRVRSGENLTIIARRHGTSVNYLLKVNDLRSGRIYPGMELRVTSRTYHPQTMVRHRVQRGESLDRIARRFGLTLKRLKEDNSLESNRIYPGQVLVIRKNET